jgi:hypothetical protein
MGARAGSDRRAAKGGGEGRPQPARRKRLYLGLLLITRAAEEALSAAGASPWALLERHSAGDRGEVPPEWVARNAAALGTGGRVISRYRLLNRDLVLVMTECPPPVRVTTVLTEEDWVLWKLVVMWPRRKRLVRPWWRGRWTPAAKAVDR